MMNETPINDVSDRPVPEQVETGLQPDTLMGHPVHEAVKFLKRTRGLSEAACHGLLARFIADGLGFIRVVNGVRWFCYTNEGLARVRETLGR